MIFLLKVAKKRGPGRPPGRPQPPAMEIDEKAMKVDEKALKVDQEVMKSNENR